MCATEEDTQILEKVTNEIVIGKAAVLNFIVADIVDEVIIGVGIKVDMENRTMTYTNM